MLLIKAADLSVSPNCDNTSFENLTWKEAGSTTTIIYKQETITKDPEGISEWTEVVKKGSKAAPY